MLKQWLKTPILIPTDFSEATWQLLDEALSSGIDPRDIHVIHVLRQLSPAAPALIWQTTNKQKRIDNVKKAFWQTCPEKLYRDINFEVLIGNDISAEILKYAAKENIGMIFLSTHNYQGLNNWLKGSIANQVIRHSSLPILVLPRRNYHYDSQTIVKLERIFHES